MRIGHGYDAHRFCGDRKLILGGVTIPYEKGLLGHSDADVVTHCIIDSILGAAALGDIGGMFPDNDGKFKDIYSVELLKIAVRKVFEKGYNVSNIDVTIICQEPKLKGYVGDMKKLLANIMDIGDDDINIKATTEEKMGFTGRLEGISAHCVSLIIKREH